MSNQAFTKTAHTPLLPSHPPSFFRTRGDVQSVHRRTPQILSVTSPLCATALCAGERGCRGVCFGLFPRFHEKSDILIVVMQIATEEVHPQRLFKGHAGRNTRNLVLIHRTLGGQGVRENSEPLEDASDFFE